MNVCGVYRSYRSELTNFPPVNRHAIPVHFPTLFQVSAWEDTEIYNHTPYSRQMHYFHSLQHYTTKWLRAYRLLSTEQYINPKEIAVKDYATENDMDISFRTH